MKLAKPGNLKIAKGSTEIRYLLSLRNGTIVTLSIAENIDLTKYANKQVLVTGYQDSKSRIITVTDIAEIEVYNATEIPQSSPIPTPTLPAPSPSEESTTSATY